MDQSMDRSPLEGQQIDPETFRRVWERVMPDQGGSPIALNTPGRRPAPPPRPQEVREEDTLGELMDLAWAGVQGGSRLGPRGMALADSRRRGLKRLAAARFLLTGQRYIPRGDPAPPAQSPQLALRQEFLWEQSWVRRCRQGEEHTRDGALKELYRELAREGERRQGMIRRMLES